MVVVLASGFNTEMGGVQHAICYALLEKCNGSGCLALLEKLVSIDLVIVRSFCHSLLLYSLFVSHVSSCAMIDRFFCLSLCCLLLLLYHARRHASPLGTVLPLGNPQWSTAFLFVITSLFFVASSGLFIFFFFIGVVPISDLHCFNAFTRYACLLGTS